MDEDRTKDEDRGPKTATLRKCRRDLSDLLRMPPLVGGHQLDPLIHVHRPEEGVIERHLAQGQPVASSQRRAERRMVALERCPSARHIHRAGRLRWLGRLSSCSRDRPSVARQCPASGARGCASGDSPERAAPSALTMRPPKMRSTRVRCSRTSAADQRSAAGRWRCMAGGMASMAPRSAPRAVSSRDRTSVRWVCMTEGYRRRGFEGKWLDGPDSGAGERDVVPRPDPRA